MNKANTKSTPCDVPEQPHFFGQLGLFLLLLPVSVLSFSLFLLLPVPVVFIYSYRSVSFKHVAAKDGFHFGSFLHYVF